ncbi:MAG TPA: ferritin-like domain-containing protein [Phycisphaerales bacterium]|nr:ferritin-like domain-containing protein [Phycisphaerales bacterium]
MKIKSMSELLVHELQDLCSAEEQLIKALPKMAKHAVDPRLKEAFEEHLDVTKAQYEKVKEILKSLDETEGREKCAGMAGIIKEGDKVLKLEMPEQVKDAALISAAQRVEHYEIAGYGTARAFAELLGQRKIATVLEEILEEERDADEKLNEVAQSINREALSQSESAAG